MNQIDSGWSPLDCLLRWRLMMISDIETILYATDLNDSSRSVFLQALNQAKAHRAKLLFLHVIEPLANTAAMDIYIPGEPRKDLFYQPPIEEIHTNIELRLRHLYQPLVMEQLHENELRFYIVDGVPAPTIIKTADKLDVDLIILGSHTHSMFENIFIGSVATKVINRTTRPVLLVPVPV